jgi:alpha-galactosidase
MGNEILIFSYKVARDLIQNGFVVKDIRPNHKVQGATVIVFEKSKAISNYLKGEWGIKG